MSWHGGVQCQILQNMIAKLKNILRCYAVGMGIKETANTFHISRNTVRKYVRLFISSGKPTDQLLELAEEQLRDMFGCTEFRHREPSQRQPFSTSGVLWRPSFPTISRRR